MVVESEKELGLAVKNLFHAVAVCVADFGIDEACAGLGEDDALYCPGLLGGLDDVFG